MLQKASHKKMPTLAHVLTPFPHHIEKDATAGEAKQLMADLGIHHVIVLSSGDMYGLLTERDLLHHLNLYGARESEAGTENELLVSDLCLDRIVVADINDPLDRVLEGMVAQKLGSVVVLKNGDLAGIFTMTDACKQFANFLQEEYAGEEPPDIIA
ncbi:MAG: CBS domain-containing protein [Cellvibrionaceae bacterium]